MNDVGQYRNDIVQYREAYLAAWARMLPPLLGWSDEQTATWSRQWEPQMNDEYSLFFHEDPIWYVVPLLIPDGVTSRLGPMQRVALERRINHAVIDEPAFAWSSPDVDWAAARARVARVLADYSAM